jgi:hypothetical protein
MGILVIKLQEYRMSQGGINAELKHVTVLEEAHNILKNEIVQGSGESSNIAAKSVEMIANSIAEMRTYGEGFIIVDQAPGLMDMSVIRNTNTKIIMRLPDQSDRELVGKASGLNEKQIEELARLQQGVAAVYQNEWIEPVLCKIQKFAGVTEEVAVKEEQSQDNGNEKYKNEIATCLCDPNYLARKSDLNFVDAVEKVNLSGQLKRELLDYYRTSNPEKQKIWLKAIHMFFEDDIKELIDKLEQAEAEESSEKLKDQIIDNIKNKYGLQEIASDGKWEYRFAQGFLFECIEELSRRQEEEVDACQKLEEHMSNLERRHKDGIW